MTRTTKTHLLAAMASLGMVLSGCAGNASEPPSAATTTTPTEAAVRAEPATFEEWRTAFRARALAAGVTADTFDRAFANVAPNEKVVELDTRQPEFTRAIWEYLDSAVSDNRVATGRRHAGEKAGLLKDIQARYGVDYPIVLAIWGLESGYGGNFGNISVIESLATLAYEGRRKQFAEEQLIAALRILDAGDITPERMVGSWAGAMGHTQFIPTSFLRYAVDQTGDGKRDIWAPDAADALASTANYLSSFGWQLGAPAVVEVRLPDGFDYAQANQETRKPASHWAGLGVAAMTGTLPASDGVSVIVPAGARGPAFAVYPNFRVIKRYNNATSYALAVAHLAQRIAGSGPFVAAWPRGDRMLSLTEKKELQERLTGLGYDTQGIDGIIGPNSQAAVRAFQRSRGLVPDGYVSATLLDAVRAAGG